MNQDGLKAGEPDLPMQGPLQTKNKPLLLVQAGHKAPPCITKVFSFCKRSDSFKCVTRAPPKMVMKVKQGGDNEAYLA